MEKLFNLALNDCASRMHSRVVSPTRQPSLIIVQRAINAIINQVSS